MRFANLQPVLHQCKRCGMIYEYRSNNYGKPFQSNRCFSCNQELFAVTNYRSNDLDKSPLPTDLFYVNLLPDGPGTLSLPPFSSNGTFACAISLTS